MDSLFGALLLLHLAPSFSLCIGDALSAAAAAAAAAAAGIFHSSAASICRAFLLSESWTLSFLKTEHCRAWEQSIECALPQLRPSLLRAPSTDLQVGKAGMVRRKIKIKRIENATTRQVTFSKRQGGLLKKAHDLSVLCDADVGVIVFSGKGKLFQFASPSMQSVLERYVKNRGDSESPDNISSSNNVETDRLVQFTEKLKTLQSNLIGDDLESLSLRDLSLLEQQIHQSLGRIHARKDALLLEQLEDFEQKVTGARRTMNANANILETLVNFCSSEVSGSLNLGDQQDCEHRRAREAPQNDASLALLVDTMSEQSNHNTCEGLPAAKGSRITADLNRSPAR